MQRRLACFPPVLEVQQLRSSRKLPIVLLACLSDENQVLASDGTLALRETVAETTRAFFYQTVALRETVGETTRVFSCRTTAHREMVAETSRALFDGIAGGEIRQTIDTTLLLSA